MKIVNLFLPGAFEDATVYMGRLIALTTERSLRFYNLEKIIRNVEDSCFSNLNPMLTYLFVRNDWLSSLQFKLLLKNREVLNALLSTLEQAIQEQRIVLPSEARYVQSEHDLQIPGHVLLDMNIYNQRMYFGADTGFYHQNIDWETDDVKFVGNPQKRIDIRSMISSVGFGSVHISCGDGGLFSAFDEFNRFDSNGIQRLHQTENRSFRTAWSGHDLINYSNSINPILLSGHHEKIRLSDAYETETSVLTNFEHEKTSLDSLLRNGNLPYDKDSGDIQYVYNSSNTFFVHTISGDFYTISIDKRDKESPIFRSKRTYESSKERILSIHPTNVGMVIEYDDQVKLFSGGQWFVVNDSAVLSVRTFIRSKRYKSMAVITTEEGITLSSFFDENVN